MRGRRRAVRPSVLSRMGGAVVSLSTGKRPCSLYRDGCGCEFCASARRWSRFHEVNRMLSEAAASGDEGWYERLVEQQVAILRETT